MIRTQQRSHNLSELKTISLSQDYTRTSREPQSTTTTRFPSQLTLPAAIIPCLSLAAPRFAIGHNHHRRCEEGGGDELLLLLLLLLQKR